ncbi:MAG: hypothetical protein RSA54_14615, partial [Glutamicibacter sp.]
MSTSAIDWSNATRRAQKARELLSSQETGLGDLPLRNDVRESWKRSLAQTGSVQEPPVLSNDRLRLARERSELQRIWPVFEKLLVPAATDANLLVALADAARVGHAHAGIGRLLRGDAQPRHARHETSRTD